MPRDNKEFFGPGMESGEEELRHQKYNSNRNFEPEEIILHLHGNEKFSFHLVSL